MHAGPLCVAATATALSGKQQDQSFGQRPRSAAAVLRAKGWSRELHTPRTAAHDPTLPTCAVRRRLLKLRGWGHRGLFCVLETGCNNVYYLYRFNVHLNAQAHDGLRLACPKRLSACNGRMMRAAGWAEGIHDQEVNCHLMHTLHAYITMCRESAAAALGFFHSAMFHHMFHHKTYTWHGAVCSVL